MKKEIMQDKLSRFQTEFETQKALLLQIREINFRVQTKCFYDPDQAKGNQANYNAMNTLSRLIMTERHQIAALKENKYTTQLADPSQRPVTPVRSEILELTEVVDYDQLKYISAMALRQTNNEQLSICLHCNRNFIDPDGLVNHLTESDCGRKNQTPGSRLN